MKKIGQKKFWLKKDPCPKNFRLKKNFGQKKLGSKKLWSKNNVVQKIKVQRNLGPKKFWVPNILGTKNFVKRSGSKKLSRKKFLDLPFKFGQN